MNTHSSLDFADRRRGFTRRQLIATSALKLLALCAAAVLPVQAAVWPDLPLTPLAVQSIGDPNLLLTLDDSGSMASGYAPDDVSSASTQVYFLSPRINAIAYNPFDVYAAPYDPALNGNRLTTSFTAAWLNGFNTARGSVNLSTAYRPVATLDPKSTATPTYAAGPSTAKFTAQAAFIYAFYNDLGPSNTLPAPGTNAATFVRQTSPPTGCLGLTDTSNAKCYIKVVIAGNAAHEQNFAIWYSFYKTRNLTVASAANIAFNDLNPKYRVSWQTLTACTGFNNASCSGWDGVNVPNKIRPLNDATQKQNLYKYLSRLPAASQTPLRGAVTRAGTFISSTGIESPRANVPGTSETGPDAAPISACRANYHVVLTDGIWNGSESISVGNVDNTGVTLPDGQVYSARSPFKDANSNSLADIVFKQWATDAQPTLANSLQPWYPDRANKNYWDPHNDPAIWQHMSTFAIGLGLATSLDGTVDATAGYMPKWGGSTYVGDYNAIVNGTVSWPATADNSPGNVADLWHAAINGRGEFFGADSPTAVREAFRSILTRISSRSTSSGQVANSTRRVGSSSQIFDLTYVPADWYSSLTAHAVFSDGSQGAEQWNTDTTLKSDTPSRSLFTWDASTSSGRSFAWSSFTAAEQSSIFGTTSLPAGDPDLLNYLRGNRSQEGAKFRTRPQLLGDIVGSELAVSAKSDQGYQFLPTSAGGGSYPSFVNGRKTAVFVGANDGMLHGFSSTGVELFGYFPAVVLPKIKELAKSPLVHQALVDGPLTLGDAYLGGGWKTVLVGGLGGGGRAVVGLDVTSVTQSGGSGVFAASNVLFEVSDTEMGYSFAKPIIGRTSKGDWVAVWGNGYGGASGKAMLFVYNLTSKSLTKIDTGVGSLVAGTENGLSSPVGVEFSTGNLVAVYAGDYQGNLWKFNLNSSGAFALANGSTPFFKAVDSAGTKQPITAAPEVLLHPAGGVMVMFGTGKFFETQDRATRSVGSFYSIRDQGKATAITRSNLVQQTITLGTAVTDVLRSVSTNAVDYTAKAGWYLDLSTTLSGTPSGERVVARPILLNDLIAFATYTPGTNECEGTGYSYLMFLNAFNGGNLSPVYDSSGDGQIGNADKPATGNNYAGIKVTGDGTLSSPVGSLVGVQPPGVKGNAAPGQTCGSAGQPPCTGPTPAAGCMAGLIAKEGTCQVPECNRGNVWVQAGATGGCLAAPDAKYPRWMELKWK